MEPFPTIAAVSTAPGAAAVSLIRLSGADALAIADAATDGKVSRQAPRRARLCRVFSADGETIDDGLLTVFPAPHSYTGETCVEFTGHGGLLVTREVLSRFLACGARAAGPGEFTRRAFGNGKLDLTQAEGVMDLISAQTRLALRAARSQMDGHLARQTTAARDEILAALAHLEAWIDFPEEDIDPQTGAALRDRVFRVRADLDCLLATADQGRILREGLRTVIFGPPNAGKSSLLNRLVGHDRAIVSPLAGTTRDTIEETVNFHGIPLRLVDTAGLRDHTEDAIESEGISRTLRQLGEAGLLLELRDASQPRPVREIEFPPETHHLLVLNKSDLPTHPDWENTEAVRVSCSTGEGFDELSERIRAIVRLGETDWGGHAIAINARHQECLRSARHALDAALVLLGDSLVDPALAAIELRAALDSLADISGRVDTEDLLGVIFSSFCIGK